MAVWTLTHPPNAPPYSDMLSRFAYTHTHHLMALAVNSLATPQRAEAGAYVSMMVFLVSPATERLPGFMSLGQVVCIHVCVCVCVVFWQLEAEDVLILIWFEIFRSGFSLEKCPNLIKWAFGHSCHICRNMKVPSWKG